MTGFPHCSLLQAKKTWSRFICFPCFESSLHGPYLAVKRRLIYQTLFENLKPFSSFWGQFTCEPHWQPNMATMTGFPQCSLLQAKKTWTRFICFPCSETESESSLHGPYLAVKRRLIYQTLFENLKPFSSFWGQFTCEPHWQPNTATMTGFPHCSLLQAKKLGPGLSVFHVLSHLYMDHILQ